MGLPGGTPFCLHASRGPALLALNEDREAMGAIPFNDTGKETVMADVLGRIGARLG